MSGSKPDSSILPVSRMSPVTPAWLIQRRPLRASLPHHSHARSLVVEWAWGAGPVAAVAINHHMTMRGKAGEAREYMEKRANSILFDGSIGKFKRVGQRHSVIGYL